MARTADGEYELVVGNRHLLSVVFILMVLFGVFFSLGYFVGRNSTEMAPSPAPPLTARGVSQPREAPPPAASGDNPAAAADTKPVAAVPGSGAEGGPAPAAAVAPPAPAPAAEPVKEAGAGPAPGETYLQVAAVKRSVAEGIADVLKQKNFRAVIAPVVVNGTVNSELFRVLVGPLQDAAEIAKTRADLEAAGMGRPIVRKY